MKLWFCFKEEVPHITVYHSYYMNSYCNMRESKGNVLNSSVEKCYMYHISIFQVWLNEIKQIDNLMEGNEFIYKAKQKHL